MKTYDYIITGGGSAGCVIAARLTEDPAKRVLLLEAGGTDGGRMFSIPAGFAKMTKGVASWGWSTTPQKHMKDRVFWYTQAKVLGGGSTINAQIYTRGDRSVYDRWADEHGCDGWSYDDVLPYFIRAESNQRLADGFHGTGGPLGVSDPLAPLPVAYAFIRAAQEYGIPHNSDFNGSVVEGCGFYQVTQKDGRRSSTSRDFLGPARGRPNLTVETGAEATRILVQNGRAVGVRYVQGSESLDARAEAEVLVTSGAIGSPRLLMLSGIGPADHLAAIGVAPVHDLPGVGENSTTTSTSSSSPNARAHTATTTTPDRISPRSRGRNTICSGAVRQRPASSRPGPSGIPERTPSRIYSSISVRGPASRRAWRPCGTASR